MQQLDKHATSPLAININASRDNPEYGNTHQLRSLIRNVTGNDISSLPTLIQDRLDILSRTAELLGLDDPIYLAYTRSILNLSSDQLQVQLHLIQLKKIEKELHDVVSLARHRELLAASWDTIAEMVIPDTASLERQKRSMLVKAKDYQQELNIVTPEVTSEKDGMHSISSLLSLQEKLHLKEREVKVLKAQLKAFEGLPPNLELAKFELARARENQLRLMDTREKLLGRMTHGLN